MSNPQLSIIVPVLNEAIGLEEMLMTLRPLRDRGAEVIVIDGGSGDGTTDIARPLADAVLQVQRGRARQMNAGAKLAKGEILLFLHADTQLPPEADRLITRIIGRGFTWGRFDVRIDGHHWMLRVVAAFMNVRSRLTGVATGDQAIFVRRDAFDRIGGFPEQPLMEDIELSARLLDTARPACLRDRVRTSGRRWETRGVWRTIFLMWRLRWLYWRGESPQTLADAYE